MPTLPFSDSALATSDATGGITFTGFQQPRVGMWRTGSLSVVRSDGSAVVPSSVLPITWKAYVAKTIWGTWYNDQPSNLVQTGGPAVEVRGTNLAASTAYQCVFTGYDSDSPQTLSPLPAPAPPPSSPRLIVSNNVALAAGALVQVGSDQPVIVGTGLEIFEALTAHQGGGSNVRLFIRWSVDGSFTDPTEWTMDLGDAVNMRGLILPHLAPFVRFLARSGSGQEQISLTVVTGLPPIVRPPIVPGGVLLTASGNLAANGTVSVPFLYPYVGSAVLSVLVQNVAGAAGTHPVWVDCNGVDYSGVSYSWAHAIADFVSDNVGAQAAVIQPRVIHVPPLINSIVLTSQNPNVLGYTLSIVPLGP